MLCGWQGAVMANKPFCPHSLRTECALCFVADCFLFTTRYWVTRTATLTSSLASLAMLIIASCSPKFEFTFRTMIKATLSNYICANPLEAEWKSYKVWARIDTMHEVAIHCVQLHCSAFRFVQYMKLAKIQGLVWTDSEGRLGNGQDYMLVEFCKWIQMQIDQVISQTRLVGSIKYLITRMCSPAKW